MNDELRVLFELLEPAPPEVGGRMAVTIPPEVRQVIARFAAGNCTDEERDQIKKMLREKPEIIPVLVKEVRTLRQTNE